MPLDYLLQLGNPGIGIVAGTSTQQLGTTQADVYLEKLSVVCNATGTFNAQPGVVTDARVANQSLFTSNSTFPTAALAPNSQNNASAVIGVGLAAGTAVSVTAQSVGAGAFDLAAAVGTDPVPPGIIPGEFSLPSISLLFGLGDAGAIAPGATAQLTATCTRPCRLGRMVFDSDQNVTITSVLIAGAEQFAAAAGGALVSTFDLLATDEAGLSFDGYPIEAGSQVIVTITNNQAAPTVYCAGGRFCG